MSFRTPTSGSPNIIDGRWYIALRDPAIVLSVQPIRGFHTARAAQSFLTTFVERSSLDMEKFRVVEAAQVEAGLE